MSHHPFFHVFPIFFLLYYFPSLNFYHSAWDQIYPEGISVLLVAEGSGTEQCGRAVLVKWYM